MSYLAVLAKGCGIEANREALAITPGQPRTPKGPSCLYRRGNKGYPLYSGFQPMAEERGQQG